MRSGLAKSVFQFEAPGSVAKATHAGLPWLRHIRQRVGKKVHFWPFDGWAIPRRTSVVVEVQLALRKCEFLPGDPRTGQHDAYGVASWFRNADLSGGLSGWFDPSLTPAERKIARIEGWILGVT